MSHSANSRSKNPTTLRPRSGSRRRLIMLFLAGLALTMISNCASDKDQKEKKPRKPKRVRDPVEQKVFYDGWWPENW